LPPGDAERLFDCCPVPAVMPGQPFRQSRVTAIVEIAGRPLAVVAPRRFSNAPPAIASASAAVGILVNLQHPFVLADQRDGRRATNRIAGQVQGVPPDLDRIGSSEFSARDPGMNAGEG